MRALGGSLVNCPVIAATGNVDDVSCADYESAHFSGCLAKPFSRSHLRKAMTLALAEERVPFFVVAKGGE